MNTRKAATLTAALAMMATPALAAGPSDNPGAKHRSDRAPTQTEKPGTQHRPVGPPTRTGNPGAEHKPATPGPKAGLPAKAKAYGTYCQNQSKKRVEGEKGTPFSKCVTAMAKLANGSTKNPRTACKTESKKRVEGEKGTPFSKCVSSAAKLLKAKAGDDSTEQEPQG